MVPPYLQGLKLKIAEEIGSGEEVKSLHSLDESFYNSYSFASSAFAIFADSRNDGHLLSCLTSSCLRCHVWWSDPTGDMRFRRNPFSVERLVGSFRRM